MDALPSQIVSSQITQSNLQDDGRYTVREQHTDDLGNKYETDYMAEADMDQQAKLAEHAAQLNRNFQSQIEQAQQGGG